MFNLDWNKIKLFYRRYQKSVLSECGKAPVITKPLADFALNQLLTIVEEKDEKCQDYQACKAVKSLLQFVEIGEAFSKNLYQLGLKPFLSVTNCEILFPQCFYMR